MSAVVFIFSIVLIVVVLVVIAAAIAMVPTISSILVRFIVVVLLILLLIVAAVSVSSVVDSCHCRSIKSAVLVVITSNSLGATCSALAELSSELAGQLLRIGRCIRLNQGGHYKKQIPMSTIELTTENPLTTNVFVKLWAAEGEKNKGKKQTNARIYYGTYYENNKEKAVLY